MSAVKLLKISYRKAWGDLKNTEKCVGTKLTKTKRGGIKGGKSYLTPEGYRWINSFIKFDKEVSQFIEKSFRENIKVLLKKRK